MEPRISQTGVLTTVQLSLMAVLAIVVILGIMWGIRQKRARDAARDIELARVEEEGTPDTGLADDTAGDAKPLDPPAIRAADPVPAPPPPAPPPPAPAPNPVPVAPPLPPLDDTVVPGTPVPRPLADEPIAAVVPAEANPAGLANDLAAPAPPVPAASPADGPVTQLKGLGPKVAALLAAQGITTVGQIAALDETRAQALDAKLGAFTGRLSRDRWVEQARLLCVGDIAGFEAVFGRL